MKKMSDEAISFGRRISILATEHPEQDAIIFVRQDGSEQHVCWAELDRNATAAAHALQRSGVRLGSMVVVALPNCVEHFYATLGAWRLGACVLPLHPRMPGAEREAMLRVAEPSIIVSDWQHANYVCLPAAALTQSPCYTPLPDVVAHPGKSIGSGGSTGTPKIIIDPSPWAKRPGDFARVMGGFLGFRTGQTQLIAGPLYHNSPFTWSHCGLFEHHKLIVMAHFDAARFMDIVERHRVQFAFMVPTMMRRIISLPDIRQRDFSSVEAFWHSAAPCPAWLKQSWIELLGPERLYEAFGSTEGVGLVTMRGDEWLTHPGSVGRPRLTEIRIIDDRGQTLPPGEIGEIFMRLTITDAAPYRYLGCEPAKSSDGFISVGDLGWLDDQGYLFIADRRVDMIISGGANVYPAEVENALTEHPEVLDVAVIGLPDEDWGRRVHAVIQPANPKHPPSITELDGHCRERLAPYKVPKSYEFLDQFPREENGKIRRSALLARYEEMRNASVTGGGAA
jgi:bile acid-coenzyme A ligase